MVILALASRFVIVPVVGFPHSHKKLQQRAVDVTALIPNDGRPLPPVNGRFDSKRSADPRIDGEEAAKRAVNPEGWVPYMHYPSPPTQDEPDSKRSADIARSGEEAAKREVNPKGWGPSMDHSPSSVQPRSFDRQRVPFPRPVPQQQSGSGEGSAGTDNKERRDDESTILANEGEKAVDVVPIVGRAVDPTVLDNRPVDVVPIVGRAVDPEAFTDENRKAGNTVPTIERAVDVGALDEIGSTCGDAKIPYNPSQQL